MVLNLQPTKYELILTPQLVRSCQMMTENEHMLENQQAPIQDRDVLIGQAVELLSGMYGYAFRLAKSRDLADVVLQEAGVKICRYIDSFQIGTNMGGWVATIVRNTFLNLINRENREMKLFAPYGSGHRDDRDVSSKSREVDFYRFQEVADLDQMALHHFSDETIQALNSISKGNRDVVILVDLLGMSYQDAATSLGIPLGTIMSRLFRGRSALKHELAELAKSYGIHNSSET